MDTKKKTRPKDRQQRSRSNSAARPEERRRREDPARRDETSSRRPENTARRPEQAPRRQEQPRRNPERAAQQQAPRRNPERAAQQQTARRPENTPRRQQEPARRPENLPRQDTPEMVFKMDQKQERREKPRDPGAAKRSEMRRRSAKRSQERKKQARSRAPKVVYTQPRPFNANRLLLQLAIVMAVVLAITLGLSVFFKVDKVMVYGNEAYSAWTIQEASGIEQGEKLLSFGRIRASAKIKAALPYVDTVRIGINLPNTVNIYITEFDVVYAIQSQNGTWWLMTSDGKVVEQSDAGTASGYTKVLGVELDNPAANEQAKAYEEAAAQTSSTEAAGATEETQEAIPVTVTASDRLNAALSILAELERNDIVGDIASVDVTNLSEIEMWYGQRYQVEIGDIGRLDEKISNMKQAIAQFSDYEMGVLDASFTVNENQLIFTPFN